MANLLMFDSITPGDLPHGYSAYAGYVDGNWPDYAAEVAEFPGASIFSVDVNGSSNADFLDVERGDATNDDAPAWFFKERARGVIRPGFYTSVSNVPALLATLAASGISRSQIRLWTAHYTGVSHFCSPACGFGMNTVADGTQWSDTAFNGTCDESIISQSFYDSQPLPGGDVANFPKAVGSALTSSGNGAWIVGSDGGVFTTGDAQFYGSMGGRVLSAPVVGIARSFSGNGYYLWGSDGAVYAFGDAVFHGSYPGLPAADRQGLRSFGAGALSVHWAGAGYTLVALDGSRYGFGS